MTNWGGGSKSQKIDDVFYEWLHTSLNFIVLSDRFVTIDVSPVKKHVGVSKFSGLVTMMPNLETQKQNEVKSIAQRRKITRKLGRKNTSSLSFFLGFCLHNIEVLLQALK